MPSLTTYKNLQIVTPTPTADGGAALNTNFTYIADSLETLLSSIGAAPTLDSVLAAGNVSSKAITVLDITTTGRVGIHSGANLTVVGSTSLDNGAITTDGTGTVTLSGSIFAYGLQATNTNTNYIATLYELNFATGAFVTDDGNGGLQITDGQSNLATYSSGIFNVNEIDANIIRGFGAIYIGEDNVGITVDDHDVIAISNAGAALYVDGFDGIRTMGGNILDDGLGNVTLQGFANLGNFTAKQDDGGNFILTNNQTNDAAIYVNLDSSVLTANNTLDDGHGKVIAVAFQGDGSLLTNLPHGLITAVTATNGLTLSGGTLGFNGSLLYSPLIGSNSLNTVGLVNQGIWQATVISSQYGGTGASNGTHTMTYGGNVGFSGAFSTTLTVTANTTVTLPTSGTLANTTNILAPLFEIVSGNVVFLNVPTGASLAIYKFTKHKSQTTGHTNPNSHRSYPIHRGKRYYLFQTISSFGGTLHFSDLHSVKHGASAMKHGRFRFAYVVNGVEGTQTKTIEIINTSGGVPTKVRFM